MFTIICVLVGWLNVVDFLVMFLLSKDDTPADVPDLCNPFSQLASHAQHMHTSGPPIGMAVQVA